MRLFCMDCPNCGSKLEIDKSSGECVCNSCGGTFMIDEESASKALFTGVEESGYQFEKGRQRALAEARNNSRERYNNPNQPHTTRKKNRTWLWILGWICVFPIPATILLYRNKRMKNKVKLILIACVWALYFLIGIMGGEPDKGGTPDSTVTDAGIVSEVN